MQKDQQFNFEVSSKAEVISQCSCPECVSASCFVKRRANEHCVCASRAPSGLHTHLSQSSKQDTEAKPILPQAQIVPDIKKKRVKSSVNVITRPIISEFVKQTNKNVITDSTTTIFKISNTSLSQGQGNSRNTSSFIKDSSKESKKDKGSNVYCYRKKAYREGSENVNLPKDTACQNMSAAVEHCMLHQELQAPIPKAKISSAIVNLSAADIYNKIKEAYQACNCEVCECIVGKSLQNEFCACKPCECDGCANLSECTLNYIGTEVMQKHDEQCFCLLCDKKSCKVLDDSEKKLQDYHGHHENFESSKFVKDSKPCECNKCKARSTNRTLIVAPVGGELQVHNGCRCAPCECFECRHRYGVTTNGQHEISTGVNRHPNCHCEVCDNEACIPDNNQSCRCVRQSKVMSKPVEQDSHDYDIRTAHVTYNNKGIGKGNFETLAMFAALPSSYTKRIDQSKQCHCDHCDCLNCEYFDRKSQNVFQSPLKSHQLDRELHRKIQYGKSEVFKQFIHEDRAGLGMCDCIDCYNNSCVQDKKANEKLNNKCSSNHIYDCDICEFAEYENTETDYSKNRGEDVDIIRLVKSRRQTRLRNHDSLIQSCIDTLESNKKIFKQHELSIHSSKSSTSIDNFGESHHPTCHQVCYGSHRIFCPTFEKDSVVHEHVSECANEIDLRRNNKQTLNSSHSLLFSKSFVKESESVTPVTSKLKSRESSCNSSGYDYPDYLAHFPKLTVKTCFDDVMQCHLSNNIMLDMGSNNTIATKSSHVSVRDRKSFQSQTVTVHSSKTTTTQASQTFDYDIQKYINQIRNLTKETCKKYMLSKCKVNPKKEFDKFKTDSASSITTNISAKVAFNEEYIRVQKTLRDAREYSQHLVSLFEKYEKANKEFESVSERIKNSTYSIDPNINKNVKPTKKSKDTFVVQEVPTKDSECTFTSAFDEIDSINKQENYIDNRDNDGRIHGYAFINTNHTITKEKHSLDVYKPQRTIVKELNKRHIQVTKPKDSVTPQHNILQSNKLEDKQGVFTVKNDPDIVVLSDSQSLCSHRHFQESLDTKLINTDTNTDGDCHNKSNICQAYIFGKLGQDEIKKTMEERKGVTVKRDYHHIISTTFSKNLSTQCSTELSNLSKRKSILETKTENSKLLENVEFPIIDMEKKSNNVEHEEILLLQPPNESDRKAATKVISPQPIYEHAINVNKSSKELKSKIVKTKTESSELLLENVDTDKNFDDVKHGEIAPLPPPHTLHTSDGKAATEVISPQPIYEHATNVNMSKELKSKIVKTKTESSELLLENVDTDKSSDDVKQEEIVSSDRKAATENISPQPIYEHATNVNKSKELKSKSIVKTKTESSALLLENVDTDKNSDDVKHEEIISLPPPHESDGKASTEVISQQPVDEHCVNKIKALEKVQTEVKRLLDLPFLQIVKNQKSTHDKNCEAMKVTTLIAQRISDHSVAVKWKAPSLYTNVKGYEVLIDGRFVQKITNPSRRMAVISCLPHADKVLLTVRTVVAVPITDHYPAATLVYHTRKRSETLMLSRNSFL